MITEAEMTYKDMKRAVADGKLCAECQGNLSVAWINGMVLRCGNDINHHGITSHDIKFENKRREHLSMDSTALMAMDETKMMARVEMAKFPEDLTSAEKRLLAQVAINYGLDPLMGEVSIYQGRPYVSIDGRYRKAQETERLDGVESRPATKEERTDWQIPDGDYFFRADVWKKDCSRPFVGWGRVHKSETIVPQGKQAFLPVQKNPQRMAEKRAEAQALRKGFHIPLPSFEDIGAPDESPVEVIETPAQEKMNHIVAIIEKDGTEAEAKEINGEGLTLGKILNWCQTHGKQFDRQWFTKNVSFTADELKDPANLQRAYQEIQNLTGWEGF